MRLQNTFGSCILAACILKNFSLRHQPWELADGGEYKTRLERLKKVPLKPRFLD